MPEANEFKKRNIRLVQLYRTPAAPRIKEAVERRNVLLRSGADKRNIAQMVAREMQLHPTTVRKYWQLYEQDRAKYDAEQVTLTWTHFQPKRAR